MTTYPAVAHSYRERLLKVLTSSDIYTVMREIKQPPPWKNANECRAYLLANWSNEIRDRVVDIISDNIELETA